VSHAAHSWLLLFWIAIELCLDFQQVHRVG
jgi:hypothetical protein